MRRDVAKKIDGSNQPQRGHGGQNKSILVRSQRRASVSGEDSRTAREHECQARGPNKFGNQTTYPMIVAGPVRVEPWPYLFCERFLANPNNGCSLLHRITLDLP